MEPVDDIITALNEISGIRYIKKETVRYITKNLELLKDHTNENEDRRIDTVIEIIGKSALKINERKQLEQANKSVIKIIKKYKEEYNQEPNEDNVDEELTITDVENKLDSKIKKYSGFTENNPMEGISYDKNKKKYQIKYENINTYAKELDTACQKIINSFDVKKSDKIGKSNKIEKKYVKYFFAYGNHFFVSYLINGDPYFDIQHIISLLNLKKSSRNDKYKEFSKSIDHNIWHKNEFNGYIRRELINEKNMYMLLMSSNSQFSKRFKNDVADILVELRKDNKLEITNEKLNLKKNTKYNNSIEHNQIIQNLGSLSNMGSMKHPVYTYMNSFHLQYLQMLIEYGSRFPISGLNKK